MVLTCQLETTKPSFHFQSCVDSLMPYFTVVTLELNFDKADNNVIKDDAHKIHVGGNSHVVCQPK